MFKAPLNVTFKMALNARVFRLHWSLLKVFKINFSIMFFFWRSELELEPLA